MKTYSHSVMLSRLLCRLWTSVWSLQQLFLSAIIIEYRSVLEWWFRSWNYVVELFQIIDCCFRVGLYLMSVIYVWLCIDQTGYRSRVLESCSLMSLWVVCWWLSTSLCPVCHVCRKIVFFIFGIFEFFLRLTLFCFVLALNIADSPILVFISIVPCQFEQFLPSN